MTLGLSLGSRWDSHTTASGCVRWHTVVTSDYEFLVRSEGRWSNPRQAVNRLVSAWEQGIPVDEPDAYEARDPLIAVAVEPVGRGGTRLTESQVEQARTLFAQGVSMPELARRFGVHRTTIWRHLRAY